MKKRSIDFLIVSGIIFAVGVIICLVGVGVSASDGEQIYSAKIGDERGYTYKFENGETDKIKISITDANVNVYGGSESSYVEVINFNENNTGYTANNSMITLRETDKVEDITGMWESGISFKGLRFLLRPPVADKQKTVNIYLAKEEYVKAFDIKIAKGNVSFSSIGTVTDYHISVESGKISFADISTESTIDIKAGGEVSTDISFVRVSADTVTVNAKRAKFEGESFVSDSCEMNITVGTVAFSYQPLAETYTVDIATKGKLTVNGTGYLDKYVYPEKDTNEDPPEEGEEAEPSALKLVGEDLYVNITTFATEDAAEDTEAA